MATYKIKAQFAAITEAVTTVNGRTVALNGTYSKKIEASPAKPAHDVTIQGATQSDLKAMFERGDQTVELIESKEAKE
jgi:copper chaperone CopZ